MNERFFDLNKSKQDRVINSALSVFTENGYAHASTDEIIGRAGISKGLLFHYFGSKLGTYAFLYEYSTRYVLLALKNEFKAAETDYFSFQRRLSAVEAMIMKTYPCMLLFIRDADREKDSQVKKALEPLLGSAASACRALSLQAKVPQGYRKEDTDQLSRMLDFCRKGLMQSLLSAGKIPEEAYRDSLNAFLAALERGESKDQPQGRQA